MFPFNVIVVIVLNNEIERFEGGKRKRWQVRGSGREKKMPRVNRLPNEPLKPEIIECNPDIKAYSRFLKNRNIQVQTWK